MCNGDVDLSVTWTPLPALVKRTISFPIIRALLFFPQRTAHYALNVQPVRKETSQEVFESVSDAGVAYLSGT